VAAQEESIATVLLELRALAADFAPVPQHLADIDAQLDALPTSAEVAELRKHVHTLQQDMTNVMTDIAAFKIKTDLSEAEIARDAGVAGDAEHKEVIRTLTDPGFEHASRKRDEIRTSIAESEARGEVSLGKLRDRLNELIPAIKEIQSTTLLMMTIGSLFGAVLLFIVARAVGL
jgi:hypothetical protein